MDFASLREALDDLEAAEKAKDEALTAHQKEGTARAWRQFTAATAARDAIRNEAIKEFRKAFGLSA